jgi:mannose-6-phosphate isomerase-like protein (cupin superfamily)
VIDVRPGYVVKHIALRSGQRLLLQRHRHRDEHWIVAAGKAEVV